MSEIILYDIPSKGRCASWSLNPWKARLALNYKGLDYKTQWLEFPDIAPTLKNLSISPNPPPLIPYTSPTIRLPSGPFVMESRAIATAIETLSPLPSLHLDAPVLAQVEDLLPKAVAALYPALVPDILKNLLNAPSEVFVRREKFGGMEVEEWVRVNGRAEGAWVRAREPLGEVARCVEGPFCLGEEVSYADFVILGFLQFCKRIDQRYLDRVVEMEPVLGRLYAASEGWLARDT